MGLEAGMEGLDIDIIVTMIWNVLCEVIIWITFTVPVLVYTGSRAMNLWTSLWVGDAIKGLGQLDNKFWYTYELGSRDEI